MVWASGRLEGGRERQAPKAGAGICLCSPSFPQCIPGALRKGQGSLLCWEPALSCKVLGALGGGVSSQAQLGCTAGDPGQGSLLWPALQAGSVLPMCLTASRREPHPLMGERCCKYTTAAQPACCAPAPCHPWQQHGVSLPCSWLGQWRNGSRCPRQNL